MANRIRYFYKAPGTSAHDVLRAITDDGLRCTQTHDNIGTRPRAGWAMVSVRIGVDIVQVPKVSVTRRR